MLGTSQGLPGSDLEGEHSVHAGEAVDTRAVPKGAARRRTSRGPHIDRLLVPRSPEAHLSLGAAVSVYTTDDQYDSEMTNLPSDSSPDPVCPDYPVMT